LSSNASRLAWSGAKNWSIDSTDVAANASIDSLQPRFAVEAHIARLFDEERLGEDDDEEGGDHRDQNSGQVEPISLPVALRDEARADLADQAANRHDWIGTVGRPDRSETSGAYRRTADDRVSMTDADASPLRPNRTGTHLGYHDHAVVDGGKARIILTTLVTPAAVQDNQPALDLLWRARFRWKLRPRQVTGDTTYGTVENIVAIEDQDIRAYVPLSKVGQGAGLFGARDFRYDADADVYRCPGETVLRFLSQSDATHRRIDQAPAADCKACALPDYCTTSPRGRRISRSLDEIDLDRVREYHATEPFAKAMRKRKVWVEPLFAEAKEWHGLRRFRLRGAENVNIQAQLIATGQNLKRLLSKHEWGRCPWPCGAVGVVTSAATPVSVGLR